MKKSYFILWLNSKIFIIIFENFFSRDQIFTLSRVKLETKFTSDADNLFPAKFKSINWSSDPKNDGIFPDSLLFERSSFRKFESWLIVEGIAPTNKFPATDNLCNDGILNEILAWKFWENSSKRRKRSLKYCRIFREFSENFPVKF